MKPKYFMLKFRCKIYSLLGGSYGNRKQKDLSKKYFIKNGIEIGDNCAIFSDITSPEGYLIHIGDNVTISNDVQIITHDNSIDRFSKEKCDVFGEVHIGSNCFIGARTIILPGVSIADFVIVGSGSVVTKSFLQSYVIVAGNPAKVIGSIENYLKKYESIAFGEKDYSVGKKNAIMTQAHKVIKEKL